MAQPLVPIERVIQLEDPTQTIDLMDDGDTMVGFLRGWDGFRGKIFVLVSQKSLNEHMTVTPNSEGAIVFSFLPRIAGYSGNPRYLLRVRDPKMVVGPIGGPPNPAEKGWDTDLEEPKEA